MAKRIHSLVPRVFIICSVIQALVFVRVAVAVLSNFHRRHSSMFSCFGAAATFVGVTGVAGVVAIIQKSDLAANFSARQRRRRACCVLEIVSAK